MPVVYVDRVFLLNTLVDYLLLLSTARLAGRPLRRGRFLIAASVGGLYASGVFYIAWLSHPLMKLLCGILMAIFSYRKEPRLMRLIALFFLLSGCLAGILLGIGLADGEVTAYLNRLYSAQISWPLLLISTVLFSVLLHVLLQQGARHGEGEIMEVTISIGGNTQQIRALHDTGNTLRDPISGRPVLVVEQQMIKELLTPEIWRILSADLPAEEKMAQLHRLHTAYRFTLLPFRSVGVSAGLLLAIWSDDIKIGKERYAKTLLALSPGPVGDGGGYQALWGAEERGKRHEAAANHSDMVPENRQAG